MKLSLKKENVGLKVSIGNGKYYKFLSPIVEVDDDIGKKLLKSQEVIRIDSPKEIKKKDKE